MSFCIPRSNRYFYFDGAWSMRQWYAGQVKWVKHGILGSMKAVVGTLRTTFPLSISRKRTVRDEAGLFRSRSGSGL